MHAGYLERIFHANVDSLHCSRNGFTCSSLNHESLHASARSKCPKDCNLKRHCESPYQIEYGLVD